MKISNLRFRILNFSAGFTLIELLVTIGLLSILSTAIMALINPLEQVNRGNDTANQSDARQLLDAINRFYANNGYYPWQTSANAAMSTGPVAVNSSWQDNAGTAVLSVLSANTSGASEINASFVNKVTSSNYNTLYVYNGSDATYPNRSTYICFVPKSKLFREKAKAKWGTNCGNMSNFPDIGDTTPPYQWGSSPALITICNQTNGLYAVCLP